MIRRASKKTVVEIYKVMYTVHCEKTLRIEAIECINIESLDWLWCMCTSRMHKLYNFYMITFDRYFKCILGVQIWCFIVRAQLLGERPKGKYRTAKQLNGPRGFGIGLKLGKCHLSRRIHTLAIYKKFGKQSSVYVCLFIAYCKTELETVFRGLLFSRFTLYRQ